jgi:hypothetical protein
LKVKATKVRGLSECVNPGDFFMTDPNPHEGNMRRLTFKCPCGCGDFAGIRVRADGIHDQQAWGWNKDEEKPTTTPSIMIGQNHWHGYLTDGEFVSC